MCFVRWVSSHLPNIATKTLRCIARAVSTSSAIQGQTTGVKSKAMASPCGKIGIPINEEGNEQTSQMQEYLERYHGEGIQHIALGSTELIATVDALQMSGRKLLTTSRTYYELRLQIFGENQLGPIFFEFIQRKGNDGFGEGNFKALFEIELDQRRRGVLAK